MEIGFYIACLSVLATFVTCGSRLTATSISFSRSPLVFVLNGSQYNSMLMLSLWKWMNSREKTEQRQHTYTYPTSKTIVCSMYFSSFVTILYLLYGMFTQKAWYKTQCVCMSIYIRFEGVVFILTKIRIEHEKRTTTTTNSYNNGNNSSYNNSSYCVRG